MKNQETMGTSLTEVQGWEVIKVGTLTHCASTSYLLTFVYTPET